MIFTEAIFYPVSKNRNVNAFFAFLQIILVINLLYFFCLISYYSGNDNVNLLEKYSVFALAGINPFLVICSWICKFFYRRKYGNDELNDTRQFIDNFYWIIALLFVIAVFGICIFAAYVSWSTVLDSIHEREVQSNQSPLYSLLFTLIMFYTLLMAYLIIWLWLYFNICLRNKVRAKDGKEPLNGITKCWFDWLKD